MTKMTPASVMQKLHAAYDEFQEACDASFEAKVEEENLRTDLEAAQRAVVLRYAADPTQLGKNEEARKAKTRELTDAEFQLHQSAVKQVADTSHRRDKAEREVRRWRDTIALLGVRTEAS